MEIKPRLLILGSTGFLGSNLALSALQRYQVFAHCRSQHQNVTGMEFVTMNVFDVREIENTISSCQAQIVINCVALADVDECERNPELAKVLNADLPKVWARVCGALGVQFVHISTDAVFGESQEPSFEETSTSPVNEYGRSKARGEEGVLSVSEQALVVRTNFYGWSPSGKRSLMEFFLNNISNREITAGFVDLFFRPLSVMRVWDLVDGWLRDDRSRRSSQIRHATGAELLSKYEFGRRVVRAFGYSEEKLVAAKSTDIEFAATRQRCLNVIPTNVDCILERMNGPWDLDSELLNLRNLAESGYREKLQRIFGNT